MTAPPISHEDACQLSRTFNATAWFADEQTQRINAWLKEVIALALAPPSPVSREAVAQTIAEAIGLRKTEADPHSPTWEDNHVFCTMDKEDWLRAADALLALFQGGER